MNYSTSLRSATLPVSPKTCKIPADQPWSPERSVMPQTATPVISKLCNQVLNDLPKPLFEEIRPNLRRTYLRKDSFVYQQDDLLTCVYFPESAVLSELHILDDGRMVEVSMTGPEGGLGLGSLFSIDRIANCVQASQSGNVLKIETQLLRKLLSRHSILKDHFCEPFANYIRQLSQRAVCNMYHSVKERFCTWLLMMHDRCGQATLRLTHEQIARALGVYRPSITCIALELRNAGTIDYSRGRLMIIDRETVETEACSCYADLKEPHMTASH